jgi:hypothetical protein
LRSRVQAGRDDQDRKDDEEDEADAKNPPEHPLILTEISSDAIAICGSRPLSALA